MDVKIAVLFLSMLVMLNVSFVRPSEECAVAGDKRQNCGWGGITAQQCENEGCCFDSSIRGVPWCFHKRAREECVIAGDERKNCGWGGITAQQCENEGCCFDSSIRGVPWCFHEKRTDQNPNPTNGGYSQWGYWSRCSVTCSTGQRSRSRSCTNPPPSSGGKDCSGLGPATQTENCNRGSCIGFGCETRSIKRIIFYLTKPGQTCKEGCKEDGKNCEDYGKPDFLYHNANPFEYFQLECSKKVPYDTNYDDTKDGDNTNDVEAYDPATKICYGYTDKSVYNSKCDRKPADPTWKRLCMCDFWEKKTFCPGDIGYYGK